MVSIVIEKDGTITMYNTRMRKCLKLIYGAMGKLRHSWGKGEPKT